MTADFLWPIAFQNLDAFLRQWQPLLPENLADKNVISWNRNNNSWFASLWPDIRLYFSSVLLEVYILGLVIPRDLWKHRYLNAYGFEDTIHWKQKINSFLLENHKATFYDHT